MNQSELQAEIQEQSKKYLADLEKCINNFEKSVVSFMMSDVKKVLVIETRNAKLGAVRIIQILKQLKHNRENQKVSDCYLITKNQTFLSWRLLVDVLGLAENVPEFTNLLVCEFPELTSIDEINSSVLNKIICSVNGSVSKKLIFIVSQKGLLNEHLRNIEVQTIPKIDEFKNKISSIVYGNETEALMADASNGHVNGARDLLTNAVDVNAINGLEKSTALYVAAEKGNEDVVLTLLEKGAQILPNISKDTPLHMAARNGHGKIIRILLENNVDVNIKGRYGWTPLHEVAFNGDNDLVNILLQYGTNVNAETDTHATALYLAASKNKLEVVDTLLRNGALVLCNGYDPLNIAALLGHKHVVLSLLRNKVDANIKGYEGTTALYNAALRGHNDLVKILLEYGADIDAKTDKGSTALHIAASQNQLEVVKTLLNNKARIMPNNINETPLILAAEFGHKDIVSMLLDNGDDINFKTNEGQTALHQGASSGCNSVVEVLLKNGANVNCQADDGSTALHKAAEKKHVEVVKTLLMNGAFISPNKFEETPLHLAARNNLFWNSIRSGDVVNILLEHHANVNARTNDDSTALHIAAGSYYNSDGTKVLNSLLNYGAEINATNNMKNTPLHVASSKGRFKLVKFLKERGANVEARNKEGKTALDFAVENQRLKLAELLRS